MKKYLKQLKTAFVASLAMFVICGLVYPLVLTLLSQSLFNYEANGSLIKLDDEVVGSEIVGQDFTDAALFHSRPSAYNYNTYENKEEYAGLSSGSQNLAPSNPELSKRINEDVDKFLKENPTITKDEIPADIITASGSGLDPHISIKAARVQVDRVSSHTGLSKDTINKLINENTEEKVFGIFGEDKVNVLKLNLALCKELNK